MGSQVQMIKIVYLITDLTIGGAQKVLVHILEHLDRRRFAPTVACLYGGESSIADEIRALGIPVVDLGMTTKWRIDALWRLYFLLRRRRPAILHAALFHANLTGRLLGRLAGVPILITWRHSVNIGGTLREFINRRTIWLDDKVVAVCELARQSEIQHARVPPDKVITVYNGIDTKQFTSSRSKAGSLIRKTLNIPQDAPLLGSIGRLSRPKDITNLLNAMIQVKTHIPTVRLLIVGDGELREELETRTKSLNLSNIITYTGLRDDIPGVLSTLDSLVLSSRWEGLSIAVLEAMASGLPIVATAVGGTPEVVVDGKTGILVAPRDPEALADAIIFLLQNPDLRHQMGQAGRLRVEQHFSIQKTVRKIENLYNELLAEKGLPR